MFPRHALSPSRPQRCVPGLRAGLLLAACTALAGAAAADTVYRWTDDKGTPHFSDKAPADRPAERLEVTGPPLTGSASHVDSAAATAGPEQATTATSIAADEAVARHQRCVNALAQLRVLSRSGRVYRPEANGERTYLADADRAAETARLRETIAQSCGGDEDAREAAEMDAARLYAELSPACAAAREELEHLQGPDSHTPADVLDDKRAFVEEHCAQAPDPALWRPARRYVRPPR